MKIRRRIRWFLLSSLVLLTGVAGCRSDAERRLAGSVLRELDHAAIAADAWVAAAPSANSAAAAAGYLERLRLGLGSPFRLVDLAQHDPRLSPVLRTRLGWAILGRVLRGDSYVIDPMVLDRVGTIGTPFWPGVGAAHLQLIEQTITDADSVRAAELGLRLGYAMAAAEKLVSSEAPQLIGWVAALLADRELARADAERLLQALSEQDAMDLSLVASWRGARHFGVEQPRVGALPPKLELAAIEIAHEVLSQLRKLGLEYVGHGLPAPNADKQYAASLLSNAATERLIAAGDSLDLPPVTPIVIVANQVTRDAAKLPWLSERERRARARFNTRATNEETFVAELARLQPESVHDAARPRAAVQAAVAMRAYAQEPVWFPGLAAPGPRDLQERYGLADVTFDRAVPAHWRPYYRRMLAHALDDLYRVLPALRLDGLRVHFGAAPARADALAIHDPRTRRLLLPPATAAGTIAHEVAHDIDWQTALRRYHVRGDYATDRASRRQDDILAARIRSLTSATLAVPSANARVSAHATRPAEVFARNVDWFVAVSLAQEGRRNGYLSSVQDELITGYGTVRPPDVSGTAGDILMAILADLAPVYRQQRNAFRALYGTSQQPRAYELVRRIIEVPSNEQLPPTLVSELAALHSRRNGAWQAIDAVACGIPTQVGGSELQIARRDLVLTAATSYARGAAQRYSERWLGRRGRDLLLREFYGGPLPVTPADPIAITLAARVAADVADAMREQPVINSPFELLHPASCSTPASFQ